MRILVYGDSNSWGCPPDGSGLRIGRRWPVVAAQDLGADLIEDALPGRTTVHDDAQMHGQTQNGLAHLPAALLAAQPVDWLLIMLGTNDFKTRFAPDSEKIARNTLRLVECARQTGGGPGVWGESPAPRIGIVVPPSLPARVDELDWDRVQEWQGGRVASLGLAQNLAALAPDDVGVLDAGQYISGDVADPIHFGPEAHLVLGKAVADWLRARL